MSKKIKSYLIYLFITFGCVIADLITKQFAVMYLKDGAEKTLIPYLFGLTYVENKGAAWGIFADRRWIFMLISSVSIVLLLFVQFKFADRRKLFCIPLASLIGGGIGNMVDRISLGYVVDFLTFEFWPQFPVFNVADCFVTVSSFILAIYLLFFDDSVIPSAKKENKDEIQT